MSCPSCGELNPATGHSCQPAAIVTHPVAYPSNYAFYPSTNYGDLERLLREAVGRLSARTDWETQDFCRRARKALGDT